MIVFQQNSFKIQNLIQSFDFSSPDSKNLVLGTPSVPDGIAGDHITWLFKQPGEQEVHDFWTHVEEIMAFPDEHTQQLLIGHAPVRKCVCGVPCSIVVCKITGDIFWTCAPKKCFYLLKKKLANKILPKFQNSCPKHVFSSKFRSKINFSSLETPKISF